jgi:hypothetical protein
LSSPARSYTLEVLAGRFAVARLDPHAVVPDWAVRGALSSITRTPDELSCVCEDAAVPGDIRAERGFRALRIQTTLDFGLVGIVASLTEPLARARVPVFVVSTHDTDYFLVKEEKLAQAARVLRAEGHTLVG